MVLADVAGKGDLHQGHRLWPHIESWAAELGLTGPDAIARACRPPRGLVPGRERASGQPDSGGGRLTSQPGIASRSPGSTGRVGWLPEDQGPRDPRALRSRRRSIRAACGTPPRSVPRRNRNRRPGYDPQAMGRAGSSARPAGVRVGPPSPARSRKSPMERTR